MLIVDDEPSVATTLARALARAGIRAVLASDSDEAMKAIASRRFDVILSDVHLQGASGVDLLRGLRAHDLDVPVILMTGGPDISSAIEAVELGALQYLCKPFEIGALVTAIRHATRLHEMALLKREALELLGFEAGAAADLATLGSDFDRSLASMRVALQPIVSIPGALYPRPVRFLRRFDAGLLLRKAFRGAARGSVGLKS